MPEDVRFIESDNNSAFAQQKVNEAVFILVHK